MPKKLDIPPLKRHKSSGQAYCRIRGKSIYFGKYHLPETKQNYRRFIAEWLASERTPAAEIQEIAVVELCAKYFSHAKSYYRKNGEPTDEIGGLKIAIRYLKDYYGDCSVSEFNPRSLKTIQSLMVQKGNSRKYINKMSHRIKRIFKWGVEEMLVDESVYNALRLTSGLKKGRTDARETEPVKPVPDEYIDAVRPYVSFQVWAMIQLQLLTAARPGEITKMRMMDIDKSRDIWIYNLVDHKTSYRGNVRRIPIGPKAQEILHPFLINRSDTSFVFSPKEAEAVRRKHQHNDRKTPLCCGNKPGSNRKRKPKKQPGDHYKVSSYRGAIQRACEKAEVPKWSPHQLRHNAATLIRKEFGLEAAQVILGHTRADVTQIYAERNEALAAKVIEKIG